MKVGYAFGMKMFIKDIDENLSFRFDFCKSANWNEVMEEPMIWVFDEARGGEWKYNLSTLDEARGSRHRKRDWGWLVSKEGPVEVSEETHKKLIARCHSILKDNRLFARYLRETSPW